MTKQEIRALTIAAEKIKAAWTQKGMPADELTLTRAIEFAAYLVQMEPTYMEVAKDQLDMEE